MVTAIRSETLASKTVDGVVRSRALFHFVGLGTDAKPLVTWKGVLIGNGSQFIAMGAALYIYDEENAAWVEDAGGSGSGSPSANTGITASEVLQLITLAMGNTPITRIVVEDEADTTLAIENWDTEYVVPGTSLETLDISLPESTPTSIAACIKVTILSVTRYPDPEDESNDPLLLPPTITLPDNIYFIGGYPEFDGDRWCLTIDNNLTATAMVIPAPPAAEEEEEEEPNAGGE